MRHQSSPFYRTITILTHRFKSSFLFNCFHLIIFFFYILNLFPLHFVVLFLFFSRFSLYLCVCVCYVFDDKAINFGIDLFIFRYVIFNRIQANYTFTIHDNQFNESPVTRLYIHIMSK